MLFFQSNIIDIRLSIGLSIIIEVSVTAKNKLYISIIHSKLASIWQWRLGTCVCLEVENENLSIYLHEWD